MPELVNVPDVDGVPAVLFAPGGGLGIALVAADAVGLPFFGGAPQWGLFRNGQPVVTADTVLAFDYKGDWSIADYPLERGAFESYNKVQIPFDVRIVYTAGGSEANRADLLASIQAIQADLNLYDAVTPERVHPNVNIIHVDYRRTTQNGVGLLIVSVWCQEVREGAIASSASATGGIGDQTASVSGASQTNDGAVQATDPTAAQASTVNAQSFASGYDVSGYSVPTYSADVGELIATDPDTGQELGRVPGGSALPQTSSTISGLSPAGPDQFTTLNVGTGGLS